MNRRPSLLGRGRWIAALLATSFLFSAPGFADPGIDAREGRRLVEDAKLALLAGEGEQARTLTASVIAQADLPSRIRAEALLTRCAATFHLGDYTEAFALCEDAESVGGRSWRIHGLRGMAHLGRGDVEAAVDAFQAALRMDGRPILRRGLREALRARYRDDAPETTGTYAARVSVEALLN